ncbi:hypothetical protein [Streptomyces sp. NBC_00019]|uniref:hypothetical protein n=1 Tax=Streptomyces sp. NBC_00019 TaxID=2975623 RepID=UPI00325329C3
MRLMVRVKLLPTPEQTQALEATLRACNRAADYVSLIAFQSGVRDRNGLQKVVYGDVKAAFGLSAQPAVRVVRKVVDAYATLAAQRALASPRTRRAGAEEHTLVHPPAGPPSS